MVTGEQVIEIFILMEEKTQVPFLMEGGAEYMAQYWYSMEPDVDSGYLKRVMEYKAEAINPYLN